MTMPFERTRALLSAGEFLAELLDPVRTPGVPDAVRGRARHTLRHYPSRYDISVIAEQAARGALANPMPHPQTIQIFLPCGDPRGVRAAEITTRSVQVVDVPRSLLAGFLKMPESDQVAVYLLIGHSDDGANPIVYIGQADELRKCLAKHNRENDFWERVMVLISRTNSLTQTHSLFLAWHCIQEAKKAGRYATENGADVSKPNTPAPMETECIEIFEAGRTLLATLGHPVFETVAAPPASVAVDELFYCNRSGCNAIGEYTQEGFVVLEGSLGCAEAIPSILDPAWSAKRRIELLSQGKAGIENGALVFKADVLFSTPSAASAVVCGEPSNGWKEWKNDKGVSLHRLKRGNGSVPANE